MPDEDLNVVIDALVSVSCYAAPVSPPAPDIAAESLGHARWRHVPMPKSRAEPRYGTASQQIQVQI
ncbi:hypothetical protein BRCH_01860 [Candidatus Burkholderia brachyanthoides]|nr:hypothetical protein BRCH_01860 [Candidatus Burkholderia brachyanthoides]